MRNLIFVVALLFAQVSFAQVVSATKDVTTAGTQVALTSSRTTVSSLVIQAKPANTGYIYIGDNDVSSSTGIRLSAGEKFAITTDTFEMKAKLLDLSDVWIDSSVNAEGVILLYLPTR